MFPLLINISDYVCFILITALGHSISVLFTQNGVQPLMVTYLVIMCLDALRVFTSIIVLSVQPS